VILGVGPRAASASSVRVIVATGLATAGEIRRRGAMCAAAGPRRWRAIGERHRKRHELISRDLHGAMRGG
jgi:hypothetical protein